MTAPKGVKRWYAEHGIPFIESDWGPRLETGEGASRDPALPREGHERPTVRDEHQLVALEEQGRLRFPWLERQDDEYLEAVERFLTPYMANLPYAQGRVLAEWMYGRKSQREVADGLGVSQANVSKRLRDAGRRIIRAIADDYRQPADTRPDDFIAWQVFQEYVGEGSTAGIPGGRA